MWLYNPGKTEVIQFTSRFVLNPVLSQFSVGNTIIELPDKVRDLEKELHFKTSCQRYLRKRYFYNKINQSSQKVYVPR